MEQKIIIQFCKSKSNTFSDIQYFFNIYNFDIVFVLNQICILEHVIAKSLYFDK